ncbi:MAG: LysR family transcriptional regulator [Myxococcota bacterium]
MSRLEDLTLLAGVVETGSFSAAAARLGTTQPRVSRAVARLEAQLGLVLVRRSPRRVAPTDAGRRLARTAQRVLAELAEVEAELKGGGGMVGPLSLSAPPAVGRRLLAEPIAAFCSAHPGVRVDWALQAERVDLIGQEVDIAVRFGPLAETWRRARRLLTGAYHLFGAPGVADHATFPEGLATLPTIGLKATILRNRWPFRSGTEVHWTAVEPILWADDADALIALAVAGAGVTMVPDFLVARELAEGQLVRLTTPEAAMPAEVFAVTGPQAPERRAAALVDTLVEALRPSAAE